VGIWCGEWLAIVGGRSKPEGTRLDPEEMANIASQKKRILRTAREHAENQLVAGAVKTHFRRLEQAVSENDSAAVAKEHRALVSRIDKAVQKGALHSRNAARKKSRAAKLASRA
jgi:small subunit ribosomal protein S20